VGRPGRARRPHPADADDLLPQALITVEDLAVYRAVLRAGGPFGDVTVGEVMAHEIASAGREMTVRAAAELLLARGQALLPVLDERGGVAGVLSDGDLVRRAGLPLPLRVFAALTDDERRFLLEQLPPTTLGEALTAEARTIYVESSIPQAISPLIEWGLEALPVADRAGRLAGLFGVEQALSAARRKPSAEEESAVRDAEPPTPVGLVMQRAVPTIAAAAPLRDVIAQLLAVPDRFLVVVEAGRPLGAIADLSLLERLHEPHRAALLAALRAPATPPALPDGADALSAGALADTTAPTINARTTQDEAIGLMLEGGYERLIVVDDDGRLAGLLARRGLLRALAQESAG
jgi:CBS-domain-containing membrane protein